MDPPAFRHTVIYGPSVPEPIVPPQEGEAGEQDGAEGGSVVLALTDGRAEPSSVSGLLLDSNKSDLSLFRSMSVSLRPGHMTVPASRIAATQPTLGMRVPLPPSPAPTAPPLPGAPGSGGTGSGTAGAGSTGAGAKSQQLPPILLPRVPLPKEEVDPITAAVKRRARLRAQKRAGTLETVSLTPSTLLVANCHPPTLPSSGTAECFVVVAGHVRTMSLVPQSASVATLPMATTGPPQHQSCEPFALPESCVVLADWVGVGTPGRDGGLGSREGIHLYRPPSHGEDDIWGADGTEGYAAAEDASRLMDLSLAASAEGGMGGDAADNLSDAAATNPSWSRSLALEGTGVAGDGPGLASGSWATPPSALAGIYLAFVPGDGALQLQLPPSMVDDVPLVMCFRSDHPRHHIEVYWVDYGGQLTLRRVLSCGEEYRELSWASHPWVLRDAVTSESLLVCCGPGAAASEISCMAYWTSAPAPRAVSLAFSSTSTKRLTAKKKRHGAMDPLAATVTQQASGPPVGSVLALESTSEPGSVDEITLDADLSVPKVTIVAVDVPAPPAASVASVATTNPLGVSGAGAGGGPSFLQRAFAVREGKRSIKPRAGKH